MNPLKWVLDALKSSLENYRTTVLGAITIVFAVYQVLRYTQGDVSFDAVWEALMAIWPFILPQFASGLGLIFARDSGAKPPPTENDGAGA